MSYTIDIPKSVISQVGDIYVVPLMIASYEVELYHEVMMEEEEKRRV